MHATRLSTRFYLRSALPQECRTWAVPPSCPQPCQRGMLALVAQAMKDEGIEGGPKLGLDCRSADLLKDGATKRVTSPTRTPRTAPLGGYVLEPGVEGGGDDGEDIPEKVVTSSELVDILVPIFKSQELITLEDPVATSDEAWTSSKRASSTLADLKTSMDTVTLRFNMAGIGGDSALAGSGG